MKDREGEVWLRTGKKQQKVALNKKRPPPPKMRHYFTRWLLPSSEGTFLQPVSRK